MISFKLVARLLCFIALSLPAYAAPPLYLVVVDPVVGTTEGLIIGEITIRQDTADLLNWGEHGKNLVSLPVKRNGQYIRIQIDPKPQQCKITLTDQGNGKYSYDYCAVGSGRPEYAIVKPAQLETQLIKLERLKKSVRDLEGNILNSLR